MSVTTKKGGQTELAANQHFSMAQKALAAGRFSEAEAKCRACLAYDKHNAAALNLLGQIFCEQKQFDAAIQSISDAISCQPHQAALHQNLGLVQWCAGHVEDAIASYRRALEFDPEDAEVLNNLGVALRKQNQVVEAVSCFEKALSIREDLAMAHRNLAEIYRGQGRSAPAVAHFEHAEHEFSSDAKFYFDFAQALVAENQHRKAIEIFEKALKLQPRNMQVVAGLATALHTVGRLHDAVPHYEEFVRVFPDNAGGRVNFSSALKALGRADEAVTQCRAALKSDPEHVNAHNALGAALADVGEFREAILHLETALQLDPDHAAAYFNLGDLAERREYQFSAAQLNHMEALLSKPGLHPEVASQLSMTLARVLDRDGRYDEAFELFKKGNDKLYQLKAKGAARFDATENRRFVDRYISMFDRSFFQRTLLGGNHTDVPVFVVGMPRSGTTLIEQIIASHPEATGLGERWDIDQITSELPELVSSNQDYPECVADVSEQLVSDLAARYLRTFDQRSHSARRVVDKMWANFFDLGFISVLFPKARVIHCRRNPMDVCLSCYFSRFNVLNWTWRLKDVGSFYVEYERLMQHWDKVLPIQIYEVSYEEVVTDPATSIRNLIDFCGLEWSESCLRFHDNRRVVQTASRVQVRQPIYSTSIDRWKSYEKHLQPLRQVIEGTIHGTEG